MCLVVTRSVNGSSASATTVTDSRGYLIIEMTKSLSYPVLETAELEAFQGKNPQTRTLEKIGF